jgi:hypothetical protein
MKIIFSLLGIVPLGIAGILVSRVAYALRNRSKIHVTHDVQIEKSVPQITSEWDYRPRNVILRDATVAPDRRAEPRKTYDSSRRPSAPNQNADVWFSFASEDPTPDVRGSGQ